MPDWPRSTCAPEGRPGGRTRLNLGHGSLLARFELLLADSCCFLPLVRAHSVWVWPAWPGDVHVTDRVTAESARCLSVMLYNVQILYIPCKPREASFARAARLRRPIHARVLSASCVFRVPASARPHTNEVVASCCQPDSQPSPSLPAPSASSSPPSPITASACSQCLALSPTP